MKRILILALVIVLAAGAYVLLVKEYTAPGPSESDSSENGDEYIGEKDESLEDNDTESPDQTPQGPATVVRTINTTENVVVLTFDAGSDRGFAASILDTLKSEGIKASFGMTGKWAETNPDIVQRISAEGHDFINHTWSHGSLTGFSTGERALTQAERWSELERTENFIRSLTGRTTKPFFRPPYGDYNNSVLADVGAKGYAYNVMWTVDSLGWRGLTKEEITERVVAGTVPGAIRLFHVGEQSQDAAALPEIIRRLRGEGYTFARVSDLLE